MARIGRMHVGREGHLRELREWWRVVGGHKRSRPERAGLHFWVRVRISYAGLDCNTERPRIVGATLRLQAPTGRQNSGCLLNWGKPGHAHVCASLDVWKWCRESAKS